MKPNKSRLRMWVQALRSGEFTQARRGLRKGDAYCCLGVACEIFRRQDTKAGEWRPLALAPDSKLAMFVSGEDEAIDYLPASVRAWYGLDEEDPYLETESGDALTASRRNDLGTSFQDIATFIEQRFGLKRRR